MARKLTRIQNADEAPFSRLLASRPKRGARGSLAASTVSVLAHAAAIGAVLYATRAVADAKVPDPEQYTVVEIPKQTLLPPPPPTPKDVAPPAATPDIPRGFQTIAIPDIVPTVIPPPNPGVVFKPSDYTGEGVRGGTGAGKPVMKGAEGTELGVNSAPHFTPMTVAPRILNQDEVVNALIRDYPPLLRDAGIGGSVQVWFFIDEQGRVRKRQIDKSSGYPGLDAAALKIADIMRFSPALNRERKVSVWVSLPITFTAK